MVPKEEGGGGGATSPLLPVTVNLPAWCRIPQQKNGESTPSFLPSEGPKTKDPPPLLFSSANEGGGPREVKHDIRQFEKKKKIHICFSVHIIVSAKSNTSEVSVFVESRSDPLSLLSRSESPINWMGERTRRMAGRERRKAPAPSPTPLRGRRHCWGKERRSRRWHCAKLLSFQVFSPFPLPQINTGRTCSCSLLHPKKKWETEREMVFDCQQISISRLHFTKGRWRMTRKTISRKTRSEPVKFLHMYKREGES